MPRISNLARRLAFGAVFLSPPPSPFPSHHLPSSVQMPGGVVCVSRPSSFCQMHRGCSRTPSRNPQQAVSAPPPRARTEPRLAWQLKPSLPQRKSMMPRNPTNAMPDSAPQHAGYRHAPPVLAPPARLIGPSPPCAVSDARSWLAQSRKFRIALSRQALLVSAALGFSPGLLPPIAPSRPKPCPPFFSVSLVSRASSRLSR